MRKHLALYDLAVLWPIRFSGCKTSYEYELPLLPEMLLSAELDAASVVAASNWRILANNLSVSPFPERSIISVTHPPGVCCADTGREDPGRCHSELTGFSLNALHKLFNSRLGLKRDNITVVFGGQHSFWSQKALSSNTVLSLYIDCLNQFISIY